MAHHSGLVFGSCRLRRVGRWAVAVILGSASLAACSRSGEPAVKIRPQPATAPVAAPAAVAAPSTHPPVQPVTDAAPVDATLAAELMEAIFADDFDRATGAALAVIEEGEEAGYWSMTMRAANTLPDGRTVAIVNGKPSDEHGGDTAGHISPGMVNVFVLRRQDDRWNVLERHLDVTTSGTFGDIGRVRWIDLGAGKPGFLLSSGGTWQGSTILSAEIFDLGGDIRSLGGFSEMSGNSGACTPDTDECWETEGRIGTVAAAPQAAYRDIVVDFSDKRFRVSENAKGETVEHLKSSTRQSARYRFDGKQYVLVSGTNPVQGF